MSIAVPTYASDAIKTYAGLITEVRDLMDDANYSQTAINRALRKAEAEFNRSLRTPEMETQATLNVTAELTALPADFMELRSIFQTGSPTLKLTSMSPGAMQASYTGLSGVPSAYSIEGSSLRVAPVGTAALSMIYYAAIPALSDAQISNWLLLKHPDLYVAGIMYHLARRERDSDGMAQAAQEVSTLMDSVNGAAQRSRWGSAPLTPRGMGQVRGARI